jgi:hypothetical protein
MAGSAVEMIVESMFSMNKATATISGTMRVRNISNQESDGQASGRGGWAVFSAWTLVLARHGRAQPPQSLIPDA